GSIMVGVQSSETPNFLNSTVIVGVEPAVDAAAPAIGTGNSPPARKLAGWPLVAVRFGSARTVTNPSCASAETVAAVSQVAPPKRTPSEAGTLPATAVGLKVSNAMWLPASLF